MSVGLYMDVHVRQAVTDGLRLRGVDVLTAQENGADRLSDAELLDRATESGRILFTQDDDFLVEAVRRQRTGEFFAGVVYAHQLNITIGECIDDLELIALASNADEWKNRLTYLPLK
ncbi:MAG: DUF5615 family PIN-like protein [Acidobacteriota bacterium]